MKTAKSFGVSSNEQFMCSSYCSAVPHLEVDAFAFRSMKFLGLKFVIFLYKVHVQTFRVFVETKTAFTRCRHILKTVKNVTVTEFELAFTRCRNSLKR